MDCGSIYGAAQSFTFFPLCKHEGNSLFLRSLGLRPSCLLLSIYLFFQSLWVSLFLFVTAKVTLIGSLTCSLAANTQAEWELFMMDVQKTASHDMAKRRVGAWRRRSLPIIYFTSKLKARSSQTGSRSIRQTSSQQSFHEGAHFCSHV